jgi:hypothetical protein
MAVQAKAAPIMKSPYRVGFEIVHHNDDNTRLVGIFVFRVNKDLYYAPVFFINGSIKGTDLFYRHTTKSFVPLNEPWVEYLISLSDTSESHGVPISERTNTRRQLNLQGIVSPPNIMAGHKSAAISAADRDEVRQLAAQGWAEIKTAAVTELPAGSILRRFITADGGFSAIAKIANAAKEDFDFAQALFKSCNADDYMPELEPYKTPAPVAVLTLNTNVKHVKSASAEDLHKGYAFEDKREKSAMNEVIYEANDRSLRSVTEPGVYQVLMADGSTSEMLCAYHKRLFGIREGFSYPCEALKCLSAIRPPRANASLHTQTGP